MAMGVTAENVADKYDISREEMDEYALQSHMRAVLAGKDGIFAREIIPVPLALRDHHDRGRRAQGGHHAGEAGHAADGVPQERPGRPQGTPARSTTGRPRPW